MAATKATTTTAVVARGLRKRCSRAPRLLPRNTKPVSLTRSLTTPVCVSA